MDLCAECLARGDENICGRRHNQGLCPIAETWAVTHLVDQVKEAERDTERAEAKAESESEDCEAAERVRDRAEEKLRRLPEALLDQIRGHVKRKSDGREPRVEDYEEAIKYVLEK